MTPPRSPGRDRYEGFAPRPPAGTPRTSSWWSWRGCEVHLEHVGDPDAAVRMLLVHGGGGNAAALWPWAAHLAATGAVVTVPDLPGYGETGVPDPGGVRYPDWQRLLIDLVHAEHDGRPLVVLGASMGGLLAWDTVAATGLASALVATCLLDPREPAVRARLTRIPLLGRAAVPVLRVAAGPMARVRVPVRWVADMRHVANDPALVAAVLRDRQGGGGRVPLGWMRSYLEASPVLEPEEFTGTPVLLVHPAEDRWTPVGVSRPFYDRIAAPKDLVLLEGCGHFPVEQPGFRQMIEAVAGLVRDVR
ncbi:alpha/beta fold hydrolase [Kocuria nitroreducens]|uniref:alpha/beta fold hydrolase n=1 Tax=Kocuria nitroreducens TaxID=3058914 RepID=UPI0036DE1001